MSASQIACMSFNNFTCFVCLLPVFILPLQCWNPSYLSCPLAFCLPVTAGQPPVCISITHLHLCCLLSSCLFVYWSVCLSASLLSTPLPLQSPLPAVSVAILPIPMSVCRLTYLSVIPLLFSVCHLVCLSFDLYIFLSVARLVPRLSVCLCIRFYVVCLSSCFPSVCLSVFLPACSLLPSSCFHLCCLFVILSVCLMICLSLYQSVVFPHLSVTILSVTPLVLYVCHPGCLSIDLSVCRLLPWLSVNLCVRLYVFQLVCLPDIYPQIQITSNCCLSHAPQNNEYQ